MVVTLSALPVQANPFTSKTVTLSTGLAVLAELGKDDTIHIDGGMNGLITSDTNENGEGGGEPLRIQSTGGLSFTQSAYQIPFSLNHKALQNETVTAFISGADGDESVTLNISVNPSGLLPGFSLPEQNAGSKLGTQLGIISGVISLFKPFVGALTGILGGVLGLWASDPPDTNYKQIATPGTVTLPDQGVFNALAMDEAKAIQLAQAASTSMNRAQGAFLAGDSLWQQRQSDAANAFVQQTLAQLTAVAQDLIALRQAMGLQTTNITANDILSFELRLASVGFTTEELSVFHLLGLDDPTFIAYIQSLLSVQDINAATGSYPDQFDALGRAILEGESSLVTVTPEPTTLLLFGTTMTGLGLAARWRRRRQ